MNSINHVNPLHFLKIWWNNECRDYLSQRIALITNSCTKLMVNIASANAGFNATLIIGTNIQISTGDSPSINNRLSILFTLAT